MISYLCPKRKLDVAKISPAQVVCYGKTVESLSEKCCVNLLGLS